MAQMDTTEAPGIVGVATSGIQDVSALLPLLGTQQCENHAFQALQRGFLYAAATPMSIFGSLGLVKAGFTVLWASSDYSWFPGPRSLRNAGFLPPGIGELLLRVDEYRGLSVVEQKIQLLLSRKAITSVTINLKSWDLWKWNLCLVAATTFLSGFGLLPYILLIHRLPNQSFETAWLYPIIRIVACDIIAISITIIFQIRILEEAYFRIRFLAMDSFLKRTRCGLPDSWSYNQRSKDVLEQFRRHADETRSPLHFRAASGLGRFSSFAFNLEDDPKDDDQRPIDVSTNTYGPGNRFITKGYRIAGHNDSQGLRNQRRQNPSFTLSRPAVLTTTLLLWPAQLALLLSACAAVVGYLGCFKVVQTSPKSDSIAPLVWLILEACLAVIRMALWAWNPSLDDPKTPIALQKVSKGGPEKGDDITSGISWNLDSATTDDLHAVIIGISDHKGANCGLDDIPQCTEDARRLESYLKDTLRVPPSQVVTLLNDNATRDRILDEIKALAHKESMVGNAPVVVYISTYTFLGPLPHILPYVAETAADEANLSDVSIDYSDIEKLLEDISKEKTDNIVCFAPDSFVV